MTASTCQKKRPTIFLTKVFLHFSIAEAVRVKDKFNGEEVSGRTLSIEFSSGADFSGDRRDQFISSITASGGTRDCVTDRGANKGRGRDNDQKNSDRGNEYSSNQSESNYSQNGRGSNHNNEYTNSDSFERVNRHDYGDSNHDSSYTQGYSDNHDSEKRRYLNSVYDHDRKGPTTERRSQSGSNRRNRSRSREKNRTFPSHGSRGGYDGHVGDDTTSERADRHLYDPGCGLRGMNGSTDYKAESCTSISVVTLPFSTRDGRFIYEHPDGLREYVKPVFSSTIGHSDPIQSFDNNYGRYPSNRSSR